jgi:hypothetical protein
MLELLLSVLILVGAGFTLIGGVGRGGRPTD